MLPISEINIGDQFENPLLKPHGATFLVIDINKEEKMVKVQAFSSKRLENMGEPFWKENTDRMFSESWRVFNMNSFNQR